jgi:hypothetical protein
MSETLKQLMDVLALLALFLLVLIELLVVERFFQGRPLAGGRQSREKERQEGQARTERSQVGAIEE